MIEKEEKIKCGDFEEASRLYNEQNELQKKLEQMKSRFDKRNANKKVDAIIESIIGIDILYWD